MAEMGTVPSLPSVMEPNTTLSAVLLGGIPLVGATVVVSVWVAMIMNVLLQFQMHDLAS